MKFGDLKQTKAATRCAIAVFWIAVVCLSVALIWDVWTTIAKGGKDFFENVCISQGICGVVLRLCYIVALPILFHRLRDSKSVAKGNLDLLSEFGSFNAISMLCGDPLAVLDLEKATSYMLSAS